MKGQIHIVKKSAQKHLQNFGIYLFINQHTSQFTADDFDPR